jgi:hypothetical protein
MNADPGEEILETLRERSTGSVTPELVVLEVADGARIPDPGARGAALNAFMTYGTIDRGRKSN